MRCPQADPWCNQRRSVALILTLDSIGSRIRLCSGALITNERRDFLPYLLTASHCLDGNEGNWLFSFNYQSPDCSNPATEPDINAFTISGATVRAARCRTDFALLELHQRPPGDYNVYYSGFDNSDDKPEWGASISHPRGDIKKIAFYDQEGDRVDERCDTGCRVKSWEVELIEGTVEAGSSGAPLYNEDQQIVGQVFCGFSRLTCSSQDYALFGRFDESWDGGSSTANRARDWLNPNGSRQLYIQAMSGDDACRSSYNFRNAADLHTSANVTFRDLMTVGTRTYNGVYEARDSIHAGPNVAIQNGTSVVFDAGSQILLKPGFHAKAGSRFHAIIDGCKRGCYTGVGVTSGEPDESPVIELDGNDAALKPDW